MSRDCAKSARAAKTWLINHRACGIAGRGHQQPIELLMLQISDPQLMALAGMGGEYPLG